MRMGMKAKTSFDTRRVLAAVSEAKRDPEMLAGAAVEREAKKSMRKGGRFEGPRGGKQRRPSAPGTPPNVQTGNLRASITHARDGQYGRVLAGTTNVAWYGRIHEHGGRYHPRRPFMAPALRAAQRNFPQFFGKMNLSKTRAGRELNAKKGKV